MIYVDIWCHYVMMGYGDGSRLSIWSGLVIIKVRWISFTKWLKGPVWHDYQATLHWRNTTPYVVLIDVIMTTMASQITSLMVLYSIVYSDSRSKKTSKLRVTGLCVGNSPRPVNSPHKGPVTRKMFPFDDVIMKNKTEPALVAVMVCIHLR